MRNLGRDYALGVMRLCFWHYEKYTPDHDKQFKVMLLEEESEEMGKIEGLGGRR